MVAPHQRVFNCHLWAYADANPRKLDGGYGKAWFRHTSQPIDTPWARTNHKGAEHPVMIIPLEDTC